MASIDPRTSAAPVRALLVEDDGLIAMLLEDYLTDIGITEITIMASAKAGLHAARIGDFDLAVLDVDLNGERSDGIADVLAERRVPFMFSTGFGRAGLADRHARRPVVTKPPQFALFREIVGSLLEERSE